MEYSVLNFDSQLKDVDIINVNITEKRDLRWFLVAKWGAKVDNLDHGMA